jgi:hypothetical protein
MNSTAEDWDQVRKAFASSIMVDTSLSSLAQNLDGPDWPIAGETPATYVDLSFEEMQEWIATRGLPADHADLLIGIFRDTLAFDNPFGEMVEQNEAAAMRDNQLLKNMARLGIPEGFPVSLVLLSSDTLEFCRHENLGTLGQLAIFAQTMSQTVIVGGDFRKLLNALSHVDEAAIAEMLPFRPGDTGLHLVECLGQATRAVDPAANAALAVQQFPEEFEAIKADVAERGAPERWFVVLGNPELEAEAIDLLRPHMKLPSGARGGKSRGLFGSLSRLFGK